MEPKEKKGAEAATSTPNTKPNLCDLLNNTPIQVLFEEVFEDTSLKLDDFDFTVQDKGQDFIVLRCFYPSTNYSHLIALSRQEFNQKGFILVDDSDPDRVLEFQNKQTANLLDRMK